MFNTTRTRIAYPFIRRETMPYGKGILDLTLLISRSICNPSPSTDRKQVVLSRIDNYGFQNIYTFTVQSEYGTFTVTANAERNKGVVSVPFAGASGTMVVNTDDMYDGTTVNLTDCPVEPCRIIWKMEGIDAFDNGLPGLDVNNGNHVTVEYNAGTATLNINGTPFTGSWVAPAVTDERYLKAINGVTKGNLTLTLGDSLKFATPSDVNTLHISVEG